MQYILRTYFSQSDFYKSFAWLPQTQYRNFFCSATIELGSNGKQQLFIYLLWIHLQKDIKIRAILSTMPALLL